MFSLKKRIVEVFQTCFDTVLMKEVNKLNSLMRWVKIGCPELSTGQKENGRSGDIEYRGVGKQKLSCSAELIFLFSKATWVRSHYLSIANQKGR